MLVDSNVPLFVPIAPAPVKQMFVLALIGVGLLVGVSLAFRVTAGQFAIGLTLVTIGVTAESIYEGWHFADAALAGFGLFVLSQIAYVVGIALRAAVDARKDHAPGPRLPGDAGPGPTPTAPLQGEGH